MPFNMAGTENPELVTVQNRGVKPVERLKSRLKTRDVAFFLSRKIIAIEVFATRRKSFIPRSTHVHSSK
jgi:hypothetical protein